MMQMPKLMLEPAPDESLDGAGGSTTFLQKKKGQRLASDDILLAATAVGLMPDSECMLDLGTGKGSVAIMALSALPKLRAVGVEAFAESFHLAVRNARLNRLQSRFVPMFGDVRTLSSVLGSKTFNLVTGAPPFMKVGHGILPQNEQRKYGRFEMRGGIEAYCSAAATHLDPVNGNCVMLMDANNEARTRAAFQDNSLNLNSITDVAPRPDEAPIYQIFVGSYTKTPFRSYHIAMRPKVGIHWTDQYNQLRQRIGLVC
jgi:tRNA1Val (adenine37-N6)-methyltransferase